jgi:hypothetical protein
MTPVGRRSCGIAVRPVAQCRREAREIQDTIKARTVSKEEIDRIAREVLRAK